MQIISNRIRFHGIDATVTLTDLGSRCLWDVFVADAGCLGFGGVLSPLTRQQATEDAMGVLRAWYVENVGPIGGTT